MDNGLGVIKEIDKVSLHDKGRPTVRYGLSSDNNYFLGVTINAFEIHLGLIDMAGKIIKIERIDGMFNENSYTKLDEICGHISDFIDEIDSLDGEHKKEHQQFADLEDTVMQYIEAKNQVPDEFFALVDDISLAVFDGLGIDYYGLTDIFYDIAIELELITEEDDDYYDIFNFEN